jgi:acylphosphatase
MKFLSYLTAIIFCLGLCIITVSNIAWTDDNLQIMEKEKKIVLKGQISKALGEYDSHLKGAVEYLACGPTGKLYESIIAIEASTKDVHEALSKLGVKPGTPPAYDDEKDTPIPPTGTTFLLTVEWQEDEETKKVRAEELIYNVKTNKPLPPIAWIYSGSRVISDLDSDDEDAMIPHAYMSNHIVALKQTDGSALFQNPLPESVEENLYKKNDDLLPELGTSVKLIIEVNRKMQLYVLISGKVQRVGFRNFTQINAKQLGINGYAKNLQNGKVEVVAEGDKLQLNALVKKTTTGSPCFKS